MFTFAVAAYLLYAIHAFDRLLNDAARFLTNPMFDIAAVDDIIYVLQYVATMIAVICCLIELIQVGAKVDNIRWETVLKVAIKLVLARLAIENAPLLMSAMYQQSATWINQIADTGTELSSISPEMVDDIMTFSAQLSFWQGLTTMLTIGPLALALRICGLIIYIIAFGRMFEILIHIGISPIPIAFMPLGDGSGNGVSRITTRFLRSFAAACLQGVIIIACINMFQSLVLTNINTIAENVRMQDVSAGENLTQIAMLMLMGSVALIVAITKSSTWAKTALDAN